MPDPQQVQKARIPDLPASNIIALEDRFAFWRSSDNTTVYGDMASLRTLMFTGGANAYTPVYDGGSMIYIVPIPADQVEFAILSAGGFQLLQASDVLKEGERFEIDLLDLQPTVGIGSGGSSTSTATALITDKKQITSSYSFDASKDCGKLLQLRGNTDAITLTLPAIDDPNVPANLIIVIETLITNSRQNTIATQGGQNIYMNNASYQTIYMGQGEVLWLLRGSDGWYVINDFARAYMELAMPKAAYKAGLNQLVCKGQQVNRADYPRLWEAVMALGFSLVDDTTWLTDAVYRKGNTYSTTQPTGTYETIQKPYRGCFSNGDGSTTFRLPDLMKMFLRGLATETGGDNERFLNKPGGYQNDQFRSHTHDIVNANSAVGSGKPTTGNDAPEGPNLVTNATGGFETRGENPIYQEGTNDVNYFAGDINNTKLSTGTVYSNNGVLTSTNPSDRRLKNSIEDYPYGLKEILQLQPKQFYYNSDSLRADLNAGFIAQDVKAIMPLVVREMKDGYFGLKSDMIIPALVNAIQEQQNEIDVLKRLLVTKVEINNKP